MEAYIKCTEGYCAYLTRNQPYEVLDTNGGCCSIVDDWGGFTSVFVSKDQKSLHTKSHWYYCDKNGKI